MDNKERVEVNKNRSLDLHQLAYLQIGSNAFKGSSIFFFFFFSKYRRWGQCYPRQDKHKCSETDEVDHQNQRSEKEWTSVSDDDEKV